MRKAISRILLGICAAAIAQPALSSPIRILFVGNSFTYGEPAGATGPTVKAFRPQSVTDLNGTGIGGVPALFKAFANQAGLDYEVSLETIGGTGLDYHYNNKLGVINKPWDKVVLQSYSTLDLNAPGNPATLITYTALLADALHTKNADVDIFLAATWSRADLTYLNPSPWFGKPIDAMEKAIQAGYEQAAANSPYVSGVIPIGAAWNQAMLSGVADANPYDGITPGQLNLWAAAGYHASVYGYYLEALSEFAAITGTDPRSLGANEQAAAALNMTGAQAQALQAIAYTIWQSSAAVPEPASWAMLIVGFGAVGSVMRRSSSVKPASWRKTQPA